LDLRGTKKEGCEEDYIMRNFMIPTPNQIYSGDQIEKNEMGEASFGEKT
jgi:hypothetical protein